MNIKSTIIKSIMAGICISIGCLINMSCDNKYIGAFLFSFGLLTICQFEYNLFTGKVCYLDDKKILAIILFYNFIGCIITATIVNIAYPTKLNETVLTICTNKLKQPLLSVLFLSILCNMMIFFAVDGYKRKNVIILIGAIAIFILCGFEHCVANMFYFIFYIFKEKNISLSIVIFLITNIIGNYIGGRIMKRTGAILNGDC